MDCYRLYCLDGLGKIALAEALDAPSDEEAIAQARTLRPDARKLEVWQHNRLVATLGADDLAG